MKQHSDSIAKYELYKKKGMALNNKLMEAGLGKDRLLKAGEQLGIVKDGIFVFEAEMESDVLMDFALFQYREDGRTAVELYSEKVGGADEIEKELLAGLQASYASLFKEVSVSRESRTVDLEDVMGERGRVQLTDTGLSMSYAMHTSLFMRIIPLKTFNMASGFFFAFPDNVRNRMQRAYDNFYQRAKADNDATRRYIAFFKANRIFGNQGMLI